MKSLLIVTAFLFGLILVETSHGQQGSAPQKQLEKILDDVRESHSVPGISAAILKDGKLLVSAASGLRKVDEPENALQVADKMHLGSCTKAITATLAAILVEEGRVSWSDTIAARLPSIKTKIDPSFHSVTLWQLLGHQGGIRRDGAFLRKKGIATHANRLAITAFSLKKPVPIEIRGKYSYSNLGFMVAGTMLEAATDKTWEELVQEKIFAPLEMTSAGFGPPSMKPNTLQPWGHVRVKGKTNPDPLDNAASLGPAGTVHSSIGDWAKFISVHLDLTCQNHKLLKPESLQKLHTAFPAKETFALPYGGGWVIRKKKNDDYELSHNGSNARWYSTVYAYPKTRTAILVVSNIAPEVAEVANEKVVEQSNQILLDEN